MESDVLKYYLEELEEIGPLKDSEQESAPRDRLIEGNLKNALQYLYDYLNKGVDLSELVCEANLSVTSAVDRFLEGGRKDDLKELIEKSVREGAEALIEETAATRTANEQIAERLNELSDVSVAMVDELGRQATSAELAHRLNTTEDEIERLLKMSMEAL